MTRAGSMAGAGIENSRADTDGDRRLGLDLPACAYRRAHDGATYCCEAAAGAVVTAGDCRSCSIPAAVSHKDACLYLTPLRHEGKACYACRWFFSAAKEPVVEDWRHLCFCSYWFPRGGDEGRVMTLTATRRVHYLKVLRGEAPRRSPRPVFAPVGRSAEPPRRAALLRKLSIFWPRLARLVDKRFGRR
jgi:hypothetical protein